MPSKKKKKQAKTEKAVEKRNIFSKDEYRYLSLIVLAGIILRLIYVFETQGSPFFQNLFSDSKIYYDLAIKISSGSWIGNEIFFMSPGYPYFLAVIFTILGKSILLIRLIQVVLNSINIVFIYLIARNLHSDKAGYFAAGIAALYSSFIFYSGAVLLEIVQTFILSLFLVIVTNKELMKKESSWLWAGLLIGIASYFRANILLVFPVIIVWFLVKIFKTGAGKNFVYRTALYFSIGCIVPVMLVTVRNYLIGDDYVLISSNGGINFYLGNNENAPGIYKTPGDFDFFSDLSGEKYAERITGKSLSPSEASSFWLGKSLEYIEGNPVDWLELTGRKLLFFFDNNEIPQSAVMDPSFFAENYSTILKLPLPGFFIVFIVSVFGFLLTWERRKEYTVIYIFTAAYVAATVMFFIIGRFRVAVSPVFIVFAGIALIEGYSLIKAKNFKKLLLPAGTAGLFILGVFSAVPKYSFSNYDAYIDIGSSMFEKQEYDKALSNFQKAASLKADANAYVLLGNTYAAENNFKQAIDSYYKAINNNPAYYLAYFNLGIVYTQTRNLEEAGRQFRKTIDLDSTFEQAYRNLAIIDYINGDYKSSLFNFEKFRSLTDDEQAKKTVEQDIMELKRRLNVRDR